MRVGIWNNFLQMGNAGSRTCSSVGVVCGRAPPVLAPLGSGDMIREDDSLTIVVDCGYYRYLFGARLSVGTSSCAGQRQLLLSARMPLIARLSK